MTLQIVKASGSLLDELFRFRHQIYVGELGVRALASADGRMVDQYDDGAINYAAMNGDRLVGSFRVNRLDTISNWPSVIQKYAVKDAIDHVGVTASAVCGRLAVAPERRSSEIMIRLVATGLHDAISEGIRFSLADCSPYLLCAYTRLGWISGPTSFYDPTFGLKIPICLSTRDHEHFRRLSSPFVKVAANFNDDTDLRQFRATWLPTLSMDRIGLPDTEERISAVISALSKLRPEASQWLAQMEPNEATRLCRRADIFQAHADQRIVDRAIADNAIYVAAHSAIESEMPDGRVDVVAAGTPFSASQRPMHGVTSVARATLRGESELFVLPTH